MKKKLILTCSIIAVVLIGLTITVKKKDDVIVRLILGNNDRIYNHIGIPTDVKHDDEIYIEAVSIYVSKDESNPYGVEWVRHLPECPFPDLIKNKAHVAFIVKNLSKEIAGKKVIFGPINHPQKDVAIAFIDDDGVPIELVQIGRMEL